jgi:hypothetical protein
MVEQKVEAVAAFLWSGGWDGKPMLSVCLSNLLFLILSY